MNRVAFPAGLGKQHVLCRFVVRILFCLSHQKHVRKADDIARVRDSHMNRVAFPAGSGVVQHFGCKGHHELVAM